MSYKSLQNYTDPYNGAILLFTEIRNHVIESQALAVSAEVCTDLPSSETVLPPVLRHRQFQVQSAFSIK